VTNLRLGLSTQYLLRIRKLTLGAAAYCIFGICLIDRQELVLIAHNYKALSRLVACYGCLAGSRVIDGRRVVS
jgi:hypothetical protein